MTTTISESTFRGVRAFVMEDEALRVVLLPDCGAKIASMVHKPSGRELLLQGDAPAHPVAAHGAPYDHGDVSGFDEMFPTIDSWTCDHDPWRGVEMPDHGEVWAMPWQCAREGDALRLSVEGIRFPFRVEKVVSLRGGVLRAEYEARNLSNSPLPFLWAAHPLFNAEEGTELLVPRGMDRVRNAAPGNRLGARDAMLDFPEARLADGSLFRLDRVPAFNGRGFQKHWFESPLAEGWCGLRHPSDGLEVRMEFPAQEVPWLGVWVNEGGVLGQYCIAPEPATAPMDSPGAAEALGRGSVLAPGAAKRWWLAISAG